MNGTCDFSGCDQDASEMLLDGTDREFCPKHVGTTEMTEPMMTLRERVIDDMHDNATAGGTSLYRSGTTLNAGELIDRIASLLEDTGSPAHMRVAAELRGEQKPLLDRIRDGEVGIEALSRRAD